MSTHAHEATLVDVVSELGVISQLLRELVETDSGQVIAVRKKLILNAADPFDTFKVDATENFHAIKVDNPSEVTLDVFFGGTQPSAGNSDERVPGRTGRVLTQPYDEVTIGFDPLVVPAGNTQIYVTYYSRPYAPTTYAFTP